MKIWTWEIFQFDFDGFPLSVFVKLFLLLLFPLLILSLEDLRGQDPDATLQAPCSSLPNPTPTPAVAQTGFRSMNTQVVFPGMGLSQSDYLSQAGLELAT